MSLQDIWEKIKPQSQVEVVALNENGEIESFPLFRKLFLSITIILVVSLSFGIGRLSVVGKREPIRIEYDPEISKNQPSGWHARATVFSDQFPCRKKPPPGNPRSCGNPHERSRRCGSRVGVCG